MVYDKSLNCLLDRGKMWRRRRETGGSQCQVCDLSLRRCRVLVVCYFTNTLEWVKSGCQWYVFAKEDWARSSRLLSSCLSIIYIEYLIFSYYVLHYQNICIYILYNLYINTTQQRNVFVQKKLHGYRFAVQSIREIAGRSVKAKPGAHTNSSNQNYVHKKMYRAQYL